jgi:hypothetical protein
MKLFHRTTVPPDVVLALADTHFAALGLTRTSADARTRSYAGALGTLRVTVRMEGGHYTLVEGHTDQIGESRLDKGVKKFFNVLHRTADPRHLIAAGY